MERNITKNEFDAAQSAVKNILESSVEILELGNNIPQIDDVSDSNKVLRGKLSILFVDIRKSSELTEDVKAKNMVKVYRSFIRTAIQSIRYCGGVTRQFAGDGIMGVFLDDETEKSFDKAILAARYLITMIDFCLNPALKELLPEALIGCGVGITTGTILITKVGMRGKEADDTAENETSFVWTGEATNLASRLCGLAQAREIFIDETTFQALDEKDRWTPTERTKGVAIYKGYIASEFYLSFDNDVEASAVKSDSAPITSASFVQQLFSESKTTLFSLVSEINKKSTELSLELENVKKREQQATEREKKIVARENNQSQFELKCQLEEKIGYICDISSEFTYAQIQSMGKDYWNNKIKDVKELLKKTGEKTWSHYTLAFSKIYEALQQYDDFYHEICIMAKDGYCVCEGDIRTILSKTYLRSTLKDALQSYINENKYCDTSDEYQKFLKIMGE